jgi:Fe-S oxidoreductase
MPKGSTSVSRQPVVLWPDTFNNYFHPQTAIHATEVLESAGCRVIVPRGSLCCGRPLYDYGFLGEAKALLRDILGQLRPHLETGTPIVVLEPSCLAVFRDELVNLLPDEQDAHRLCKQSYTLAELLAEEAPGWQPPRLDRRALVQRHCHHQAVMGFDCERRLIDRLGIDAEIADSGCCGMAGSFGYEAGDHYDVSMRCGERVLLPKVRDASDDTLLVADGFSCREQIETHGGRRTMHIVELLRDRLAT